jgi:hypothetical protein
MVFDEVTFDKVINLRCKGLVQGGSIKPGNYFFVFLLVRGPTDQKRGISVGEGVATIVRGRVKWSLEALDVLQPISFFFFRIFLSNGHLISF